MRSIILNIFDVAPKNEQGKIVNTLLKIFDVGFPEHWQMCQIRLFWLITIDVNKEWIYIKRDYFMVL